MVFSYIRTEQQALDIDRPVVGDEDE